MTPGSGGAVGPDPWVQRHWDWRAAGNFIGGGAGSGLILFAALGDTQGAPLVAALLGGLALVGAGLLCVWLEIGRPWRALNVFVNLRTSWMSREAAVAALLVPVTLAAAAGIPLARALAVVLAGAFLFAQSRILRAARGIPAWRAPLAAPLVVVTGLVEGGGLWLAIGALSGAPTPPLAWVWAALLIARFLLWPAYVRPLPERARRALEPAGRTLRWLGTALPFALIALDAMRPGPATAWLALAGVAAALTGSRVKHALVTRASFNQGFALARLPVRGARP